MLEECFGIIAAQRAGRLRAFKKQLCLRIRRAAADSVRYENRRAVKFSNRRLFPRGIAFEQFC